MDVNILGFRRQLVPALVTFLATCGTVLHAQTLQIASPGDGAVAYAGQSLTVSVTASGSFQFVALQTQAPLPPVDPLEAAPFQFVFQVPSTIALGTYGITVAGVTATGDAVEVGPNSIDIERLDLPQEMKPDLAALYMNYVGESGCLTIYGMFGDDSIDITRSSLLSFTSDNTAVATVDEEGWVTAAGAGTANIVIVYRGMSIQVPVRVLGPAIIPSRFSLYASQTQQFVADLALRPDLDQSVTWSLTPSVGTIDQAGLYTAPVSVSSQQAITLTATSVADPTKSASTRVWLFPPVSVGLTPSSTSATAGQARTFTAAVANGNDTVSWSLTPDDVGTFQAIDVPNPDNPLIPLPGLTYYAPSVIATGQNVTITATSSHDNSKTAVAQVSLSPSVAVSVTPISASLNAFQSRQFSAVVNYSSAQDVTWSIEPNIGTISAEGLYTAPASVIAQQTITVTATGPDIGAGPNCGTATVTLAPRISTSITVPASLSLTTISNAEIDLSWTGSTEAGGTVGGYLIFRDGVYVGSSPGTSYADRGLIADTAYIYTVAAYDTSGAMSSLSAPASASTVAGTLPGLVAYYKFDEGSGPVLYDWSGNGKNGSVHDAIWSSAGKVGGTLQFDGVASSVEAPNAGLSTAMTIEAWVKLSASDGYPYGKPANIVVSYEFSQVPCFHLSTGGYFGPNGFVSANDWWSQGSVFGNPRVPQSLDTWTHLAITYDGANVTLYVDGTPVGTTELSGPIDNGMQALYIGGNPVNNLSGMIDELRIYSRGLTQEEILKDMGQPPAGNRNRPE